ncbi:hypothetical protein RB195_015299 [Necator americanus]|uniref:Uncharacterized protein n=1 Tax=Necator americanus TaxID=51031 RepID=A0ABR1E450_NECAM
MYLLYTFGLVIVLLEISTLFKCKSRRLYIRRSPVNGSAQPIASASQSNENKEQNKETSEEGRLPQKEKFNLDKPVKKSPPKTDLDSLREENPLSKAAVKMKKGTRKEKAVQTLISPEEKCGTMSLYEMDRPVLDEKKGEV